MFQILEQAQKNNKDPEELFKQITKDYKPERMNQIFNQARQFGIPEDVISKFK